MNINNSGLFLLPNLLGDIDHHAQVFPSSVDEAVKGLDGLIAENEKEGRRFLRRFALKKKLQEMPIALLNEHTRLEEIDNLLVPLLQGECWGLISDAGLPCVADPGALLVYRARQKRIPIHAFVGPSSVMLALMLSGLPGQRFSFRGYLDRAPDKRKRMIKGFESTSKLERATQIFIEAPYRNNYVLKDLVEILSDEVMLCAAWDLTLPTQEVITQRVKEWRRMALPEINKKPTVFLFYCE